MHVRVSSMCACAARLHSACAGTGVVKVWGTSPESIDIAEDRDRWMDLLTKLDIRQPAGGVARWDTWGGARRSHSCSM